MIYQGTSAIFDKLTGSPETRAVIKPREKSLPDL